MSPRAKFAETIDWLSSRRSVLAKKGRSLDLEEGCIFDPLLPWDVPEPEAQKIL